MSATAITGEGPLFLFDYGIRFLRVALLLSLWRILFVGRASESGFSLAAVLTYTLIAEVFSDQLSCRIGLENSLWQGNIATKFLQPLSLVEQFTMETAGRWIIGWIFFSVPLLIAAPLLGVNPMSASPAAGLLFVVSLLFSISVGLALEFIMGALLIFFQLSPYSINRSRDAIAALLSGRVIPLALLPWGLGNIFEWLPFASAVSAPLRIYTGAGNPMRLLQIQAVWAIALWPLAAWLWNANRQRMVSYGG